MTSISQVKSQLQNLNSQQFQQCFILEQVMSSLQSKDFSKALFYCQKSNQFSQPSSIFSSLIKSIQGVIQMYTVNYVQAISHFTQGLEIIQSTPHSQRELNASILQSVTIKLYANLLLCYVLSNRYNESIQTLHTIMSWIQNIPSQKTIFEQLLYILFRVTNFESIGNIVSIDNQLYDQPTKACLLSAASFNQQITNNTQQAYKLQQQAYKIWVSTNDIQQITFCLRRLVCLTTELKIQQKLDYFENQLTHVLEQNNQQLGVDRKTLFKGYRQKIKIMKQVIRLLKKFDKEILNDKQNGNEDIPSCWKLATKLKLYKTVKDIKAGLTSKGKQNMNQIKYLIGCAHNLDNQSNKLVEKEIKRSHFVKTSINLMNNHITNVTIHCQKMRICLIKEAYRLIKDIKPKQRQPLQRISIENVSRYSSSKDFNMTMRTKTPRASRQMSRKESVCSRSPLHSTSISVFNKEDDKLCKKVSKYLRFCEVGEYLQKKNFSNDSGERKYVKITKTQIRWAGDDQKIDKQSKYHSYNLKQVRGILYGKFSQTFKKSSSKNLNAWNCFSLVLQKRTLDFYCENDNQVQQWITGISAALRRISPEKNHILYSPGRQKWRKMFLKLTQAFIEPMKKQQKLHHHDVAMAVILFGRHNYKLPK